MRYTQYRLAKRNGQIVAQSRSVVSETTRTSKWWQFWKIEYCVTDTIGDWTDMELPEVGDE